MTPYSFFNTYMTKFTVFMAYHHAMKYLMAVKYGCCYQCHSMLHYSIVFADCKRALKRAHFIYQRCQEKYKLALACCLFCKAYCVIVYFVKLSQSDRS